MSDLRSIYGELRRQVTQLKRIGDALIQAAPLKAQHPKFVKDLSAAHRYTVNQISFAFYMIKKKIKRGLYATNPPRVAFEALENIFLTLRNAFEEAEYLSMRLGKKGGREAKAAKADADRMFLLAEQASKILILEAKARGLFTRAWVKELDLGNWL